MYKDFGENLKRIRKSLHMSQEYLGEKCGISGPAISKYESGATKPSLEVAMQLSQLLNVSLDTLFSTEAKGTLSTFGLTEEQSEIINSLTELFRAKNSLGTSTLTPEQSMILGNIVAEFLR